MDIINNLKVLITKTPLIKIVHSIQLNKMRKIVAKEDSSRLSFNPVIGISPYKTGTTYIESCYDDDIASNDAMQHFTLKHGQENFEAFFLQRFNFLKLKLDCTGFWCGYIKELANHPIAKDLNYVFVVRKPSDWIKSTVNYYSFENKNHYFNFINEYFWKGRLGIDIINFHSFNTEKQNEIIDQLNTFYFDVLKNSKLLKNVHYVRLSNIDSVFPVIDDLIDEKANLNKAFKRKTAAQYKKFEYSNEPVDLKYEALLEQLDITQQLIR